MEDFYEILERKKLDKAFKVKDIAEVLKKPYNTVRMAIDRKSLTELEKHTIAREFSFYKKEKEMEKTPEANPGDLNDENVVDYIIEHAERLRRENSQFNMFCELIEVKAERNLMRELRGGIQSGA